MVIRDYNPHRAIREGTPASGPDEHAARTMVEAAQDIAECGSVILPSVGIQVYADGSWARLAADRRARRAQHRRTRLSTARHDRSPQRHQRAPRRRVTPTRAGSGGPLTSGADSGDPPLGDSEPPPVGGPRPVGGPVGGPWPALQARRSARDAPERVVSWHAALAVRPAVRATDPSPCARGPPAPSKTKATRLAGRVTTLDPTRDKGASCPMILALSGAVNRSRSTS